MDKKILFREWLILITVVGFLITLGMITFLTSSFHGVLVQTADNISDSNSKDCVSAFSWGK